MQSPQLLQNMSLEDEHQGLLQVLMVQKPMAVLCFLGGCCCLTLLFHLCKLVLHLLL